MKQLVAVTVMSGLIWAGPAVRGSAAGLAHTTKPRYSAPPEVQEAIQNAADEFGVDARRMLRIARCESRFNPNARSRSGKYLGLFQHSRRYWNGRVARFNQNQPWPVSGDIFSAEDNARISAWMMSGRGGFKHWSCK